MFVNELSINGGRGKNCVRYEKLSFPELYVFVQLMCVYVCVCVYIYIYIHIHIKCTDIYSSGNHHFL
jgi:hypothetical protein